MDEEFFFNGVKMELDDPSASSYVYVTKPWDEMTEVEKHLAKGLGVRPDYGIMIGGSDENT
jgi:hypothetical protein